MKALKDRVAKSAVLARVGRLALGSVGDAKPVGAGVSELRINHGPGYRVYFTKKGASVVVLLVGGDKSTQAADIVAAKALAANLEE